jgi:F-type H+-transporting ATPase subunit b
MKQRSIVAILLLVSFLGLIAFAYAAEQPAGEGEHAAAGEHHEQSWFATISQWVNFLVLAGILYYFFTRSLKIPDRFKGDYEKIQGSIESARRAKEEAELKLKELDQKMAQLNDEIARIKSDASKLADEEREKILESAHKEAERIVERARTEINSEVENARKELRKQIVDEAVNSSREIIEREMNEQDSKRLLNDYIEGFRK